MKSPVNHITLATVDDLFSTEESRANADNEKVVEIALTELFPFKNHPFKVKDDDAMADTVESIKEYGVLVPAIARPRAEGGYELVAGHRRHRASELAGFETMPVLVRNLDDDAATIIMVDSNLQRETILPSERAFAFKLKLDALKRQGERTDLTCTQLGYKLNEGKKSVEIVAEQAGTSRNQIQRYIRLTSLIPELLDIVDTNKIAFNTAVELSYLRSDEQVNLMKAMEMEKTTPSLLQAQRLKKFSTDGKCTFEAICAIIGEEKLSNDKITLSGEKLRKYFPKSYTHQNIEETIFGLLEIWYKDHVQNHE